MYQVTFLNHGTVSTPPGATILEAARALGLPLSAPCGGHGKCGKCKVIVAGREVLACTYRIWADITVSLPKQEDTNILIDGIPLSITPDPVRTGYLAAIDIGTTTLACTLLSSAGKELATQSMGNPQCAYGADVVSRIQWAVKGDSLPLTAAIRAGVSDLISRCCKDAAVEPGEIGVVSIVGNSCMQQLFLGIPVDNLAAVPFAPVITQPIIEDAKEYLPLCPHARLLTAPDISGFVGADTMGCILAAQLHRAKDTVLLVDIGTNGEMVLAHKGQLAACSTAAGPALEGAGIRFGMRGAAGAIDHVFWENGQVHCSVIGNGSAEGICGSGIVDAVAVMLEAGLLNRRGRLMCPEDENGQRIFQLRDGIFLTQEDIRQVQLAKGAIAAGIRLLCAHFGISVGEIDSVILAGAFGSYLNPKSACRIGMLPPQLEDRITAGGNLALTGAKLLALDQKQLPLTQQIAARVQSVDLAATAGFRRVFAKSMEFETQKTGS